MFKYVFGNVKRYETGEEKSELRKLKDLFKWQFREMDFNRMYYAYGLNIKGRGVNDFIGRREFLKIKNRNEKELKKRAGCENLEYDVITKDKFIFNCFLKANNISCAEVFGILKNNVFINADGSKFGVEEFLKLYEDFVLKNITLEASEGVFVCKTDAIGIEMNGERKSFDSFKEKSSDKIWLVQKIYTSHHKLREINSSALNTTRIVTILRNSEPEYLTGFQAFATGNAKTDSWDKGSVYAGIDAENECLKKYGYFNPEDRSSSISDRHPDSGIIFADFKIPYLKDAVNLCIRAHKLLYFNYVIGWDVAITDEGPIIIEANEKPGMNVVQCLDGGLRSKL
jgi:hypothetical protein